MKKVSTLALLVLVLVSTASAVTLNKIRAAYYPRVIRIVFDFNKNFNYQTETLADKIIVRLLSLEAGGNIPNYFEINDLTLKYLEVEKEGENLKVTIPLPEPIGYRIFPLSNPPRLVCDFGKEFTNIVSGGMVCEGAEYLKVKKRTQNGFIFAHILKINPKKVNVFPALAKEPGPNVLETVVSFFKPWEKEKKRHFYKDKVSSIVSQSGGVAGINGGFFAANGAPLGTLMIDKVLLSSPVYDRSSLVLTEDGAADIDNIMVDSFFKFTPRSSIKYKITGVNQGRGKVDTILYTSLWGEKTGTNTLGIEFVVEKEKVKEIKAGNAAIPEDGYVISVAGEGVEYLFENLKVGDKIEIVNNIIPYATSSEKIQHIISGGPRLLKDRRLYVSKYGERFRGDVAKGRAARTAAAITENGELLLVVVDGLPKGKSRRRGKESLGVTLEELAYLLLNLGAVEAVNLDGGSSTTMVIKGQAVNKPTAGSQKKVSNAIVIRPR